MKINLVEAIYIVHIDKICSRFKTKTTRPGPGGRSLVEIQQMSGANIQISKKGTFAPGTRNRIVTISGTQTAISNAHYLIEQKIQEEELKRTRHNAISGLMQ